MENEKIIKIINEVEELLKQSAKNRAIQIKTEKKIKEKIDAYKIQIMNS